MGMGVLMIQGLIMSRSNKSNKSNKSKNSFRSKASKTLNSTNKSSSTAQKKPLFSMDKPATKQLAPCYIPLCLSSQSGHSHVLYYNAHAPSEALFDCATARMQAVIDLMKCLFEYSSAEKKSVPAIAAASAYLLNDAMTLFQEFSPIANQLRAASNQRGD